MRTVAGLGGGAAGFTDEDPRRDQVDEETVRGEGFSACSEILSSSKNSLVDVDVAGRTAGCRTSRNGVPDLFVDDGDPGARNCGGCGMEFSSSCPFISSDSSG